MNWQPIETVLHSDLGAAELFELWTVSPDRPEGFLVHDCWWDTQQGWMEPIYDGSESAPLEQNGWVVTHWFKIEPPTMSATGNAYSGP